MKKLRKNQKGMTLVEIIVAMTLLGIMSGMFVTAAVYAVKSNAQNYQRDKEMHTQAVDAAQYNDNKNYDMDDLKVNKLIASGTTSNEFTLTADFGSGIKWETTAYGFKSKLNNYQKNVSYQLKFFQGKNTSVQPDASKGIYWVKFYNDCGVDTLGYVETPETVGGRFFDVNSTTAGNTLLLNTPTGSKSEFGFVAASAGMTDFFGFSENGGMYADDYASLGNEFKITDANFDYYCEVDADGNKTGYIIIHYTGVGTYLNQADFDALSVTP